MQLWSGSGAEEEPVQGERPEHELYWIWEEQHRFQVNSPTLMILLMVTKTEQISISCEGLIAEAMEVTWSSSAAVMLRPQLDS